LDSSPSVSSVFSCIVCVVGVVGLSHRAFHAFHSECVHRGGMILYLLLTGSLLLYLLYVTKAFIEPNDSGAWKIVHDVRARSCARCTLYCSRHKVVGEVSEIRRVLTTPQRDTVTHTVILPTIQRAPRAGCAVKSSTVLYCTYLLKRFL